MGRFKQKLNECENLWYEWSFFLRHVVYYIIILGVNIFEEDVNADETPEAIAKYIVDHLVTSVTAPVGKSMVCRPVWVSGPMCVIIVE